MTELLFSREYAALGMDRVLRSWFDRGHVRRLVTGAYVRTSDLAALTAEERYRLRLTALDRLYPGQQFSFDSAAALWRIPSLGSWPTLAHVSSPAAAGGRSTTLFRRHGIGLDPAPGMIDGILVSSLPRTLAEIATQPRFGRAVAMLDEGLSRHDETQYRFRMPVPSKDEVLDALAGLGSTPGAVRALRAIEFADGAAGSVGESLSRVQMLAIGVELPRLQVAFHDSRGHIGDVDFYWPGLGVVGEFDGHSKYGDARRYGRDLSAADLVIAEKRREDRLRQVAGTVVRWGWETARDRRALAQLLASVGVRSRRPARTL